MLGSQVGEHGNLGKDSLASAMEKGQTICGAKWVGRGGGWSWGKLGVGTWAGLGWVWG